MADTRMQASSRQGAIEDTRLPPLHKHAQGIPSKECESAGCAGPVTLPSLRALGIGSGMGMLETSRKRRKSAGNNYSDKEEEDKSAGSSEEVACWQQCLWSTCSQMFATVDEL
ncbi:hypothetical protein J3B02_005094, partial [Coemansia erecta]